MRTSLRTLGSTLPLFLLAAFQATPAPLPGKGLAQHPFLYAGEWDTRKPVQTCYIVRGGKVDWSYEIPSSRGEISDATVLANGDVLIAHQHGALVVSRDKKVLWSYDCPALPPRVPAPPSSRSSTRTTPPAAAQTTEVHTIQSLAPGKVLLFRNGNPAIVMQFDIATNTLEKSFEVPVAHPWSTHGQVRHMRLTPAGTLLIAQMDSRSITEWSLEGKLLATIPMPEGVWSAVRLTNGHTLASTHGTHVVELDGSGKTLWELTPDDLPGLKIHNVQEVQRLANGNTAFTNWIPNSAKAPNWPGTIQVVEVTPDKKVVWALSQWSDPDLGPATNLQLLDEPGTPEARTMAR